MSEESALNALAWVLMEPESSIARLPSPNARLRSLRLGIGVAIGVGVLLLAKVLERCY